LLLGNRISEATSWEIMSEKIALATDTGVFIAGKESGQWQIESTALEGKKATCLATKGDILLCGSSQGLFRSTDGGQKWYEIGHGISGRHARWLYWHPQIEDLALLGTEPAALFVSTDSGLTWREAPEVASLRDKHGWFLPYSPEAGCVRGFAGVGSQIYAAVEVGGLLASSDKGETWQLVKGSDGIPRFGKPGKGLIHPDVHSVAVHPSTAARVFAPTGGGFYYSADSGQSWEALDPSCYCRAVWIDPGHPDHLLLGPADSVDRNGRIVESRDGGRNWQPADAGLDTPWPQTMVERFAQVGDQLAAVLSDGQILATDLSDLSWERILAEIADVRSLVVLDQ